MSSRQQRVMVQPIVRVFSFDLTGSDTHILQNVIFKNLQQVRQCQFVDYTPTELPITENESRNLAVRQYRDENRGPNHCSCNIVLEVQRLINAIQGFDEFMNLVIDEAAEVFVKESKPRRELGAPPSVLSGSSLVNLVPCFQVESSSKETILLSFSRSRNADGHLYNPLLSDPAV